MLAPSLALPLHAAPPTANERFADLIGQPLVSSPLLTPAADLVGLTTQPDQQASVGLFFAQMFANVLSDVVSSFGLPGAIAGGVVGSLLTAAVNALYPTVTPQNPLVQAYAELATNVSNTFLKSGALASEYLDTIVQDWGMLSTLGGLINSGQWQWEYSEAEAIAAATTTGFNISFYTRRCFRPSGRSSTRCTVTTCSSRGISRPATTPTRCRAPRVIQYVFPVEYVWFANLLGGSADLNGNLTPFPQQPLFGELDQLGIDLDDFWRSQNGWTTTQVPATE